LPDFCARQLSSGRKLTSAVIEFLSIPEMRSDHFLAAMIFHVIANMFFFMAIDHEVPDAFFFMCAAQSNLKGGGTLTGACLGV
jgi:hypothetical protein